MLNEKTKDALMDCLKALREYADRRAEDPKSALYDKRTIENNLDKRMKELEIALDQE